jgi:hypothetical protein
MPLQARQEEILHQVSSNDTSNTLDHSFTLEDRGYRSDQYITTATHTNYLNRKRRRNLFRRAFLFSRSTDNPNCIENDSSCEADTAVMNRTYQTTTTVGSVGDHDMWDHSELSCSSISNPGEVVQSAPSPPHVSRQQYKRNTFGGNDVRPGKMEFDLDSQQSNTSIISSSLQHDTTMKYTGDDNIQPQEAATEANVGFDHRDKEANTSSDHVEQHSQQANSASDMQRQRHRVSLTECIDMHIQLPENGDQSLYDSQHTPTDAVADDHLSNPASSIDVLSPITPSSAQFHPIEWPPIFSRRYSHKLRSYREIPMIRRHASHDMIRDMDFDYYLPFVTINGAHDFCIDTSPSSVDISLADDDHKSDFGVNTNTQSS